MLQWFCLCISDWLEDLEAVPMLKFCCWQLNKVYYQVYIVGRITLVMFGFVENLLSLKK